MNEIFFNIGISVTLFFLLALFAASSTGWSVAVGGLLAWFFWPDSMAQLTITHLLIGLIYLTIVAVICYDPWRKKVITTPILENFAKALPPLSHTEQEALEAGTVWWDRELFSGHPNWEHLLKLPLPTLTSAEQAFLDGPVEKLCTMIDDWEITELHHDLPIVVWNYLKDQRFFGMIIPKSYGGLGFSATAHSAVVQKVASCSATAAVTVMVPNSLGPAELLLHYGTETQKNYYLPRLATGEEIPCFALTSPQAGSDAGSMPDVGVVCRGDYQDQKNILGIRLNWNKRYITLAPVATVLGLAFQLRDPDHWLGTQEEIGITLALIPVHTPGVRIGRRHNPLNVPFQNGPTQGHQVFIPLEMVIGGPDRVGQGWRMLMNCLSEGRAISLPALSTGASKKASRVIGNYAMVRRQFKLPIGRFEGVREVLGRVTGQTWLMDATRRLTVAAVDLGEKPSVISALTKYQLTERMRSVVNDAMDVVGGAGICLGPKNLLAGLYQSIPIGITVEGANILTRTLIVFGQGAIRAHPYLLKELQALEKKDPKKRVDEFDTAFFGHVKFALQVAARTCVLGLSGGRLVAGPKTAKDPYYFRQLSRMSAIFALLSELSLAFLQGNLKRKESISGRMADLLSNLYLASAALKTFHDRGSPKAEQPLLDWTLHHTLYGAQEAARGVLANFPYPLIAKLVRFLAFPLGYPHAPPSDKMTHALADLLLQPSAVRDQLTSGIFIPTAATDPMAQLEKAWRMSVESEALERKLKPFLSQNSHPSFDTREAIKQAVATETITQLEAQQLRQAESLRNEAIEVNDFPFYIHTSPASRIIAA
ncbi:MAG: acyl-CoA dehydrogenase [Magnetococcus sp. DMHC-6]